MKRQSLSRLMWRMLFRLFVVAIPLAAVAVWTAQSVGIAAAKREVTKSNLDQLRRALKQASDRKMLDKAWRAVGMLPADGQVTEEQMRRILEKVEADELHICDTNGILVRTSVPAYLGMDFRKYRQTLPFCELLHGLREYAQEFGPIAHDNRAYRKYVGVALRRGGFLQLGFDENRYLPVLDFEQMRMRPVFVVAATILLLFLSVLVAVSVFFRRRIIAPIDRANVSLSRIAAGDLGVKVRVGGSTEMEALADDINVTVNRLREYISEAEHRADEELEMAKSIQTNVLPSQFPPYPNLVHRIDIFAQMITAKAVGGDFYDFYFVAEKKLAVVIADVSGKGIPAALFMMRAKATLQSFLKSGLDVVAAVEAANHRLAEGNDANMFVTTWVGIVDLETGEMEYVNGGHNPPLLKRHDGSVTYLSEISGPALAVLDGVSYKRQTLKLEPRDGFLLYTDGVTEATNRDKEMYGEERLQTIGRNLVDVPGAAELIAGVLKDVQEFADGAEQADDITMLCFQLVGFGEKG